MAEPTAEPTGDAEPVGGIIAPASSGRARCRGCGDNIARGELRLGETISTAFGDRDAMCWFHLDCGACRRPEVFVAALQACDVEVPGAMQDDAALGLRHPRLPRLAAVERSASGRARCRHCRQSIAKDAWRLCLQIWEEGRFSPMGFVHLTCGPGYFELDDPAPLVRRLGRLRSAGERPDLHALATLLGGPTEGR